jgi:hypothetical protein
MRFRTSLVCAGALLLGAVACSDDEPVSVDEASSTTTSAPDAAGPAGARLLARAVDVELVGSDGFSGQTLNVDAWVEDGEVIGEFRVSHIVVEVECANTNGDRTVVLAGRVTVGDPNHLGGPGVMLGVILRDGDPDGASLLGNESGTTECGEFLRESMPQDLLADTAELTNVESGDIEIGELGPAQ